MLYHTQDQSQAQSQTQSKSHSQIETQTDKTLFSIHPEATVKQILYEIRESGLYD